MPRKQSPHPLALTQKQCQLLMLLGAPVYLVHLCDFICQLVPPDSLSAKRNLELFEVFSGTGRIHAEARKNRMPSNYFDVLKRPKANDIETTSGFLYAIKGVLRLVPGGLLWLGTPCSLLVFMSLGTSKREIHGYDIFGDEALPCVAASNTMLCRSALLALLCVVRQVFWCTEQPGTSKLPKISYFDEMLTDPAISTFFQRLFMGAFFAYSPKPTMLFGTWPGIPDSKKTFTKKRREQIKALQKRRGIRIVKKSKSEVSGAKDLRATGAYPIAFAKHVVSRQKQFRANGSLPPLPRIAAMKDEPEQWRHAKLGDVRAWLEDKISKGMFKPIWTWST